MDKGGARSAAVAILGSILLFPEAALAQDAPASRSEPDAGTSSQVADIVVTAQRREQRLQDTPIAVSAFNEDTLIASGVRDVSNVAALVPNVRAGPTQSASPTDTSFFIRGVGLEDLSVSRDPGVGIYLDGVYLGRSQGAALDNLDIKRVEILRGPQGTLFGRNTIGGAVQVVTEVPDGEFSARGQVTIGERNRFDVKAYLNGPIVADRLAASISLSRRKQDGWVRSLVYNGVRYGDLDLYSGRAKLRFTPSDGIEFLLSYDHAENRGTSGPTSARRLRTISQGGLTVFGVPIPDAAAAQVCPTRYCYTSYSSIDPRISSNVDGVSGTLTVDLGGITFKSISAYRDLDQLDKWDLDGTSFVLQEIRTRTRQRQYSQELQLSGKSFSDRLTWLIGLYYFREEARQVFFTDVGSTINRFDAATANNPFIAVSQGLNQTTDNYAAFGQGTFKITDRLSITAGARVTREDKLIRYTSFIDNTTGGGRLSLIPLFQGLPPIRVPLVIPSQKRRWQPFTFRLGGEYRFNPDVMGYVSVSTGFRSGGFNPRPTSLPEAVPFEKETTTSYEAGLKSDLFGRRLRVNVAGFLVDYKNIQYNRFVGTFQTLANAPAARIKGVELDLSTAEFGGFQLTGSLGYMDAAFSRDVGIVTNAGERINKGDPLGQAPRWTASISPTQRFSLGSAGDLLLHADYSYRARYNFYSNPTLAEIQEPTHIVNARITYQSADKRLSLSAYGLNVTNERYYLFGTNNLSTASVNPVSVAPRSEYGVELNVSF